MSELSRNCGFCRASSPVVRLRASNCRSPGATSRIGTASGSRYTSFCMTPFRAAWRHRASSSSTTCTFGTDERQPGFVRSGSVSSSASQRVRSSYMPTRFVNRWFCARVWKQCDGGAIAFATGLDLFPRSARRATPPPAGARRRTPPARAAARDVTRARRTRTPARAMRAARCRGCRASA
jgi:hypothetical protein